MGRLKIKSEYGRWAEQKAVDHLLVEGYLIRERNWRPGTSHKEVDIIAQRDDVMVFIEVKARKDGRYDPLESVTSAKMRNMVRVADSYLRSVAEDYSFRFDIIIISGAGEECFELEHLEDAFIPNGL